ncbi:hypothetical protein TELCIR_02113, partial [Teladorsagia circumcincta]
QCFVPGPKNACLSFCVDTIDKNKIREKMKRFVFEEWTCSVVATTYGGGYEYHRLSESSRF